MTVVERREVARGALSSTSPGNRNVRSYDIAPDGSRFVFLRAVGSTDPAANQPDVEARPEITVVANWFTELKQRIGR